MELSAYLDRIGFAGAPGPDRETLNAIHRAHSLAIPYENLDIHLGRRLVRDPEAIFDKLVRRRRGGWCYEMNGLLLWALREIGFDVTPAAGAVGLAEQGATAIANHLVLLVFLDEPYLADVGFGDGLLEPVPLREGAYDQAPVSFSLRSTGGDGWEFVNHRGGGTPGFHFAARESDERQLDERCDWLQTSPESGFVLSTVVQRYLPDGHATLRGKALSLYRHGETTTELLASAEAYAETLRTTFLLDLPEAAGLWPQIEARHAELFGGSEPPGRSGTLGPVAV